MWIKPNRVEKLVLAVPLWHPFALALIIGASAGIVASATSLNRWVVWLIFVAIAWSILFVDVIIQRNRGYRHKPGTWTRYRLSAKSDS